MKKIKLNREHYFFDFFGTIMSRRRDEVSIKKIWSNRLSKYLNGLLSSERIYTIRRNSELYLWGANNSEYTYREMIDVVHERIKAILLDAFTFDKENFYMLSKKIELEVECDNQLLNNDVVECVEYLVKNNKKVYILSDFYLGTEDITYFLSKKGVDASIFHKIFVSCELGCNKLNGDAYSKVASLLQTPTSKCYMIDDNDYSDGKNAKVNGFESHIVKTHIKKTKKSSLKLLSDCLTTEKKLGMSYANYALDLFYFTRKLYNELKKEKFNRVFFFAREGEFLKTLFDNYNLIMREKLNIPEIESSYLFVSRQATYSATLKPINEEKFERLFKEYKDLSLSAFLINIGFESSQINKISKDCKLDMEQLIENFSESVEFYKLKENEMFLQEYESNRLLCKRNLYKYLEQNKFFDCDKVAVVDIGWKGSIQDNIKESVGKNLSIYGYYYGLTNQTRATETNRKKGLIFHYYPDNSKDVDSWAFDYNFFERLLTASHASTKGYTQLGDETIPTLNEFSTERESYNLILPLQQKMLTIFKKISQLVIDLPLDDNELYQFVMKRHIKTSCKISFSNVKLKRNLMERQVENFGYQQAVKKRNEHNFSLKNIFKNPNKIFKAFKQPLLLANFCMAKKMSLISLIIMRMQYRRLIKCKKNQRL